MADEWDNVATFANDADGAKGGGDDWESVATFKPDAESRLNEMRDMAKKAVAHEDASGSISVDNGQLNVSPQKSEPHFRDVYQKLQPEERPEFLDILSQVKAEQPSPPTSLTNTIENVGPTLARGAKDTVDNIQDVLYNRLGLAPKWLRDKWNFSQEAMRIRRGGTLQSTPMAQRESIPGKALALGEWGLLGAAQTAPTMALTPGGKLAGLAYWTAQTEPALRRELQDVGFSEEDSKSVSLVAAVPIAAIEQLQVSQLLPPSLREGAKQAAAKTVGQFVKQQGINAAKTYGQEMGEEAGQKLIELGAKGYLDYLDKNVSVDWKKENAKAWEELTQAAVSMPFLMGPGHVAGAVAEGKQAIDENHALYIQQLQQAHAYQNDPAKKAQLEQLLRAEGGEPLPARQAPQQPPQPTQPAEPAANTDTVSEPEPEAQPEAPTSPVEAQQPETAQQPSEPVATPPQAAGEATTAVSQPGEVLDATGFHPTVQRLITDAPKGFKPIGAPMRVFGGLPIFSGSESKRALSYVFGPPSLATTGENAFAGRTKDSISVYYDEDTGQPVAGIYEPKNIEAKKREPEPPPLDLRGRTADTATPREGTVGDLVKQGEPTPITDLAEQSGAVTQDQAEKIRESLPEPPKKFIGKKVGTRGQTAIPGLEVEAEEMERRDQEAAHWSKYAAEADDLFDLEYATPIKEVFQEFTGKVKAILDKDYHLGVEQMAELLTPETVQGNKVERQSAETFLARAADEALTRIAPTLQKVGNGDWHKGQKVQYGISEKPATIKGFVNHQGMLAARLQIGDRVFTEDLQDLQPYKEPFSFPETGADEESRQPDQPPAEKAPEPEAKNTDTLSEEPGQVDVDSLSEDELADAAMREMFGEEAKPKPKKSAGRKKPDQPADKWKPIGKNASGHELFEDDKGVRSYVDSGIRVTEPVQLITRPAGKDFEPTDTVSEPPKEKPRLGTNRTVKERAKDARGEVLDALQELKDALGEAGIGMNQPLNPKIMAPVAKVFAKSIKAGALAFADVVNDLAQFLGKETAKKLRPYLEKAWDTYVKLDSRGKLKPENYDKFFTEFENEQRMVDGPGGTGERQPAATGGASQGEASSGVPEPGSGEPRQPGGGTDAKGSGNDGRGAAGDTTVGTPPAAADGRSEVEQRGEETPARVQDRNHRIAAGDSLTPGGPGAIVARTSANVDAIRLLKELEKSGRDATPDEKRKMAQYVGWGGLSQVFDTAHGEAMLRDQQSWYRDAGWEKTWGKFYRALKGNEAGKYIGLLTEEEWRDAAKSTEFAHYTSREVIESMWDAAARLGFAGGKVLEPAAGVGHFFGLRPNVDAELVGVEIDSLSGRLTKQLYPDATIFVQGLEDTKIPPNSIDLAISNVPFSASGPSDGKSRYGQKLNLHNYFLARMIDAVKPGGLVVAISTHNTMDSQTAQRKLLAEKAALVGAIRLPNAFKKNANTDVVTDILFLRKHDGTAYAGEAWTDTVSVGTGKAPELDKQGKPTGKTVDTPIVVNEYFAHHPEMALGTHSLEGEMRHEGEYTLIPKPGELTDQLAAAIDNLPASIMGRGDTETADFSSMGKVTGVPNNTLQVKDGKLALVQDGKYVSAGELHPSLSSPTQATLKQVKAYLALKEHYDNHLNLMRNQDSTEGQVLSSQKKLNTLYDALVPLLGKSGSISGQAGSKFRDEAGYYRLLGLERKKVVRDPVTKKDRITYEKSDVFKKRTIQAYSEPVSAGSLKEAVQVGMAFRGSLDLDHLARLTGTTAEKVAAELRDKEIAFSDPGTGMWVPSFMYLSGNVREKLAQAKRAAGDDKTYEKNVEALEKVQPAPVAGSSISMRLAGAHWIPDTILTRFAQGAMLDPQLTIRYSPEADQFYVNGNEHSVGSRDNYSVLEKDGTAIQMTGLDILRSALNMREIRIMKPRLDADGRPVYTESGNPSMTLDQEQTLKAQAAVQRFEGEFLAWAKQQEDVMLEVQRAFNDKFNFWVKTQYDPNFLVTPSANPQIQLRPYQKAAVVRLLMDGHGMLAHGVGSGKTYEAITWAIEGKRLGLHKKPMIAVHNITLSQYAEAAANLYPGANTYIATKKDLESGKRQAFLARIAANDYDLVIIPHSSFNLIPNDPEHEQAYIYEQIDELENVIREVARLNGKRDPSVKDLERAKRALEDRLKTLLQKNKDRSGEDLYFEQMGIDGLLVDEAHEFKKPPFFTKLGRIKGLDKQTSQRATSLMLKMRSVRGMPGNRGVRGTALATGTPVTNTLSEAWHMLRLASPHLLTQFGADTFDRFVGAFSGVENVLEQNAGGTWRYYQTLAKFRNGFSLGQLLGAGWDILTSDELVEYFKSQGEPFPELVGGSPQDVTVKQTPQVQAFNDWLKDIFNAWSNLSGNDKKLTSWVPVQVYLAGKAAAMDMRMVRADAKDEAGSKVNTAVQKIFEIYQKTASEKGTQAVFADTMNRVNLSNLAAFARGEDVTLDLDESTDSVSVEDSAGLDETAMLYSDIKRKLVKLGVPESEVALITDYKKEQDRAGLFERVNAGEVRVVIGGTKTLGTGANIQRRLAAIHNLDTPWTAADFVQRLGRGLRFGNLFSQLHAMNYGMEGTTDASIFGKILRKAAMMDQAMMGKLGSEFDDPFSDVVATAEEMMAAFAGDTRVFEQKKAESDARNLTLEKEALENRIARARERLSDTRRQLEIAKSSQADWEQVLPRIPAIDMKAITATVNGKPFTGDRGTLLETFQPEVDAAIERIKKLTASGKIEKTQSSWDFSDKNVATEVQVGPVTMKIMVGFDQELEKNRDGEKGLVAVWKEHKKVFVLTPRPKGIGYSSDANLGLYGGAASTLSGGLDALADARQYAQSQIDYYKSVQPGKERDIGELQNVLQQEFPQDKADRLKAAQETSDRLKAELEAAGRAEDEARKRKREERKRRLGDKGTASGEPTQALGGKYENAMPVNLTPQSRGGKAVSAHDIEATIAHDFGTTLKYGRVPKPTDGIYKMYAEVARVAGREMGSLSVATHEIAHDVDKKTEVLSQAVGDMRRPHWTRLLDKAERQYTTIPSPGHLLFWADKLRDGGAPDAAVDAVRIGDFDTARDAIRNELGDDPAAEARMRELMSLDYEPKKRRVEEGWAEFARHYLTTGLAARKAPKTFEWFKNEWLPKHPKYEFAFRHGKELIDTYRGLTPEERATANVSHVGQAPTVQDKTFWKRFRDSMNELIDRLKVHWEDRFYAADKIDAEVEKKGRTLGPLENSVSELVRWADGTVLNHVKGAVLGDGIRTISKGHMQVLAPSLKDIFAPIRDGKYDGADWDRYHVARHVLEIEAKQKEKNAERVKAGKRPVKYNPGMRYDDARAIVRHVEADPKKFAAFEKTSKDFSHFRDAILDMRADSGDITHELAEQLKDYWRKHASLKRVLPPQSVAQKLFGAIGGLATTGKVHGRSLEGSGLPLMPQLEAALMDLSDAYHSAMVHLVHVQILNRVVSAPALGFHGVEGLGHWAEVVDPNSKPNEFSLEEIVSQLVNKGVISQDDADLMRAVNRLRDGRPSEKDIELLDDTYGTNDFDELLELTKAVPDLQAVLVTFRQQYKPSGREHISVVVNNGKPVLVEWNPLVYEMLQAMGPQQLSMFERMLTAVNNFKRAGATGFNPKFAVQQFFGDIQTYQGQAEHATVAQSFTQPVLMLGKVAVAMANDAMGKERSPLMRLADENYGSLYEDFSPDETGVQSLSAQLFAHDAYKHFLWTMKSPKRLMRSFENATRKLGNVFSMLDLPARLAEGKAMLAAQGYVEKVDSTDGKLKWFHEPSGNWEAPPVELQRKFNRALANATVDFRRAGLTGRKVNRFLFAYLNPMLQGAFRFRDQLKKAATGDKRALASVGTTAGKKALAGLITYLMVQGTLVIAQRMLTAGGDDDEEKEQRYKSTYWSTPYFKIRKSQGPWAVFTNTMQSILESFTGNPSAIGQYAAEEIRQQAYFDLPLLDEHPILGNVAKLPGGSLAEAVANQDTFRDRTIERQDMQRMAHADRYDARTGTAAKTIGKMTGPALGLGPKKVEHIAKQASGGLLDRNPLANPFKPDRPGRSRKEMDDLRETLEQRKQASERHGTPWTAADEAKLDRLEAAHKMMVIAYKEMDGATEESKQKLEAYTVGLARFGLGKQAVAAYPDPFSDYDNAPKSLQEAVDKHVVTQANQVLEGRPKDVTAKQKQNGLTLESKRQAWQAEKDAAKSHLSSLPLESEKMVAALVESLKATMKDRDAMREKVLRFRREMGWLRKLGQ